MVFLVVTKFVSSFPTGWLGWDLRLNCVGYPVYFPKYHAIQLRVLRTKNVELSFHIQILTDY